MRRPVCYDVTRLLTRIFRATPNGIDRVDYALAAHLLADRSPAADAGATFGVTVTGFGPRLMSGPAAADAVAGIVAHWGETRPTPEADPEYRRVVVWLSGAGHREAAPAPRRLPALPVNLPGMADWVRRHGLPLRKGARALPPNSVYVNASQFPLWVASSFDWLEARPDVKAAFFIHDLLPLTMPEYFPKAELERHRKRLVNFARFGAAAIVTTKTVAADLDAHLATLGRRDVRTLVAPLPVAPVFATPREIDPEIGDLPFFVLCSTVEPRKNHLMILAVWRALVQRLGRAAPKLVLVGARGWHDASILDLVARSPALRGAVIEVKGLTTPGLKRLIDNARAVLMPSFGEGYGLPVHEALVAGAPVLASDIPVFRDIEVPGLTRLSPLAGEAWLEAIAAMSARVRPARETRMERMDWPDYFAALDGFLDAL